MRHSENMEKLINKLEVQPRAYASKRNLEDTLAAHKKTTTSVYLKPNIWRNSMKNKITKYATAASIIIASIIVLNQLGTPIDGASQAFAKVLENTNKMSWIHLSNSIDSNSINQSQMEGMWFNISAKIMASKNDNNIDYRDYKNKIQSTYYPKENVLWIRRMTQPENRSFFRNLQTNSDFFNAAYLINSNIEGRTINKSTGEYQKKKVDIYTITTNNLKDTNNLPNERVIFVDPEKSLIIFEFVKIMDSSGKILRDYVIYYSYPIQGPNDVYDLGVPRTAKIIDQSEN